MNIEELKDWQYRAKRELRNESERLNDRQRYISDQINAMDATDELLSKIDDQAEEIDDLNRQLEERERMIDDLNRQLADQQQETDRRLMEQQQEIDRLRLQLVEAKEERLVRAEGELKESSAKTTEIHNHFESGSSAQVFNSKVTGKYKEKKRCKKKQRKIM